MGAGTDTGAAWKRILHASVCCHSHFTKLSVTDSTADVISCTALSGGGLLPGRSQMAKVSERERGGGVGGLWDRNIN